MVPPTWLVFGKGASCRLRSGAPARALRQVNVGRVALPFARGDGPREAGTISWYWESAETVCSLMARQADNRLLPSRCWRLAWLAMLLVLSACARGPAYQTHQGPIMGTVYRVTARCPDDVRSSIDAELAAVDGEMSTYRPDSALSRFNQAEVDTWFPISPELLLVLQAAQRVSRRSAGAFDVTVGPLVNLWGFGPGGYDRQRPSEQALRRARSRVGYANLELRSEPPGVRKRGDVYVDLSAIAKGHGVDRVADRLQAKACTDYMVEIGGEVRVRGANPQGQPWRIGIEVPDPGRLGKVHRVLSLAAMAVATSGDYRNYVEHDGARFSHTIDPRSGQPIRHGLASVTVVHNSALWADAYATAINVLGPEAGWAFAQQENLPVLFILRSANGFEERYNASMEAFLP